MMELMCFKKLTLNIKDKSYIIVVRLKNIVLFETQKIKLQTVNTKMSKFSLKINQLDKIEQIGPMSKIIKFLNNTREILLHWFGKNF